MQEKVWEYLAAGVRTVWVADPATQVVGIYAEDHTARFVGGDEVLPLPGGSDGIALTRIFRGLKADKPRR